MKQKPILFFALVLVTLLVNTLKAQPIDRGADLETQQVFVPKNTLILGGTVAYQQHDFTDYRFLVMEQLRGEGYRLNVSPHVAYFFKDNLAAGLRFAYKRTQVGLDAADIVLGDALEMNLSDYHLIQHTYYGAVTFRNYLPIGNNLRFGLFSEIQLLVGGGQGKVTSGTGQTLEGTYQDIFEAGLQVVPGICFFVTNSIAVEASIGIFGVDYKSVDQVTNQVYEGNYRKMSADFKVDLLSVHIGISAYLPL